jgi:iron(III) transport system permease protein
VAGFQPNYAAAAAMGLSLFAFSAVGVYLQFKILGNRSYTTVTGRGYRPRLIDVKRWKAPLFAFAALYIAVAVLLPLAAIGYASALQWITSDLATAQFTWDNFRYILFEYPATRIAIQNTLLLALGGACLTLVVAGLIAWMLNRTRIPGRRTLEYIAMMPVAVPGIVFSLGLLWAWIRFPIVQVYGTLWILLICYVTIFLPYGIRSVSATLVQIDKSLEECASVCGASWGHMLRTVTLPLLSPGLWAGWTLLFISIIKELSASALLYNSRTVVLSVAVFDLWVGSSFTRVAALSLIQALIIFAVLLLARRLGRAGGMVLQ